MTFNIIIITVMTLLPGNMNPSFTPRWWNTQSHL